MPETMTSDSFPTNQSGTNTRSDRQGLRLPKLGTRTSNDSSGSVSHALDASVRQEQKLVYSPLIRYSGGERPRVKTEILKQWIGEVVEVTSDSIWALLSDAQSDLVSESVEIPLNEISSADHALLVPGAVFYWSIGYERTLSGTVKRVSEIRVRRSPLWSEHYLEKIKSQASKIFESLTSDGITERTSTWTD